MRRAMILLVFASSFGVASASPPACEPILTVLDDEGDVNYAPLSGPPNLPETVDASAVDLLAAEVEVQDGTLFARATLRGSPPRDDPRESYRYWLGWSIARKGHEPEPMDVTMQGTTQYDTARLYGPESEGLPDLGEVVVTWSNATFEVTIPIAELDEALGNISAFGSPFAASDGPHRLTEVSQGPAGSAPAMQDFAGDISSWTPIPTCPASSGATTTASTTANRVPLSAWVFPMAVALALLLRRPRP